MSEAISVVAQSGLEAKREEARAWLGPRWVRHPDYQYDPRHSTNPDIYVHARQPYLTSVKAAACLDRHRNPAYIRAERIRTALS